MMKGLWHRDIPEFDGLEIADSELKDLENDELSAEEAGFLQGYEEDFYDLYEPYEN